MILFLTNAYPDFPNSFRGHFVKKLAVDICAFNFPLVVLTPQVFKNSLRFQHELEGFNVIRFPYPSGDKQLLSFKKIPYFKMIIFLLSGFLSTLKTIKHYKCDIIHAHWVVPTGLIATIAGIILNIPVIIHARGTDIHTYASKGLIFHIIIRLTLKYAQHIIATSHEIKQIMINNFDISPSKIDIIPTGIDTKLFIPKSKNSYTLNQKEKINLIYIGGLYPAKGINDLLKTVNLLFKDNQKLSLTLIGDGPMKTSIEQWIIKHKYKDRIILKGAVSHTKIPKILQKADIFILPSLKEGTPNSLLEAMACKIPSIASNVGDIPFIIEDKKENKKDGLLFTSGNYYELAEKINLLINTPDLYKEITENTRKKAMQFSKVITLKKIINIYERLYKIYKA